MVAADFLERHPRKLFGRGRVLRVIGEALGFNVVVERAARGELEYVIERRDARSGNRLLRFESGIAHGSAIPLMHLGERELTNDGPRGRPSADGRLEDWVVGDDDDVVSRHRYIHFECVYALGDG